LFFQQIFDINKGLGRKIKKLRNQSTMSSGSIAPCDFLTKSSCSRKWSYCWGVIHWTCLAYLYEQRAWKPSSRFQGVFLAGCFSGLLSSFWPSRSWRQ